MSRKLTEGRLVVASHNQGKVREIAELLAPFAIETVSAGDLGLPEPEETGATFEANAALKARASAAASGLPALADDSGLAVDALGGAPGIYSARYAGDGASDRDNLDKLLREAPAGSALAYVCALAYVDVDGGERVVEGRCTGTLAARPRGAGGFGYDPAFVPDEIGDGRTMAELDPGEKDAISHRGRAARALAAWLAARRR